MQLLFAFTLINSVNALCEGKTCCDGKGSQWIDNLAGCKAMEVEGKCGAGGCWAFHVAPAPETELYYCCTKPHREEQKPAVAEQEQKPAVAEQQVEVQTDSKADALCEGKTCCDGKGTQWIDNLAGCKAMEVEGKCGAGGCWAFHVAPAPETELYYCCTKPHREEQKPAIAEQEQKPAVAEQQVEVQTDSKAGALCVGEKCCNSKGSSWYDNSDGCHAAQVNGKCGGCEPFRVVGINYTMYCCHQHWNDSVLI